MNPEPYVDATATPLYAKYVNTFQFTYQNGESKRLVLQPLKGEIDPEASSFTVMKVKVEVRIVKRVAGRWGTLEGDSPDGMHRI